MDLSDLTGKRPTNTTKPATGALTEGEIASTPTGRQGVDVLLGGEQSQRTTDCSWTPVVIDGAVFTPVRGDPCFVEQSRKGEMIVVWWEPGDDRAGVAIGPQAGDVKWTGGLAAPAGWLACDGSLVSRAGLPDLFAAIGTTYGAGDGSTTFGLPDPRGRVLVGAGAGSGLTPRTAGQTGGTETHVLTTAQMPSHAHQQISGLGPGGRAASWDGVGHADYGDGDTGLTGGGGSHPNMQPWLCLLAIIKT